MSIFFGKGILKRSWRFFLAPQASARGLLARAVLIALAFGALHLAGLREATCFISGTTPTGRPLTELDVLAGGLYLLAWFAFVVGAPVLLIASGLLWGVERWGVERKR